MSIRLPLYLMKDGVRVYSMMIPAGYVEVASHKVVLEHAIDHMIHTDMFLRKYRPNVVLPDWDEMYIDFGDKTNMTVSRTMFLNVNIWREMLRSGCAPEHVESQVESHLASLKLTTVVRTEQARQEWEISYCISQSFLNLMKVAGADS
jgi:hypothetical protein